MKNHARQSGFTLIEIVMVLILLGILSAVAVPKYFDLQEKAEVQAAKAMVAEVQARINGEFADQLLNHNETCSKAQEHVVEMLAGKTAGNKITVADGYTITVDPADPATGLAAIKVSKTGGATPIHTGSVAVPQCAKK